MGGWGKMLSLLTRRAARPTSVCLARGFCQPATKITTNLVGLEVVPNAPEVLVDLYGTTLEALKDIPASAEYRINVEKITNYRLKVVTDEPTIDAIESVMGLQVEEMIDEAKDELELIPRMAEWKAWEDEVPDVNEE